MAVVTRKLARGRFSHWVTFEWKGKPVWKLIPGDKAEAKRLDTLWRKQRKEGTYRDDVLGREWFTELRVIDVQPPDIEKLIKAIRADGKLSEKSITNLFSVLQGGFKRAVFEQIRTSNPCASLPPGTVKRGTGTKREPYLRQEARALMAGAHSELMRLPLTMAFYTGMRLGELAGRRFRDWAD